MGVHTGRIAVCCVVFTAYRKVPVLQSTAAGVNEPYLAILNEFSSVHLPHGNMNMPFGRLLKSLLLPDPLVQC